MIRGIIIGVCDAKFLHLTLLDKKTAGPEAYIHLKSSIQEKINDDSIVFSDAVTAMGVAFKKHPKKIKILAQMNHSRNQFTRKQNINGKIYMVGTQRIDGNWAKYRHKILIQSLVK